MLSYRVCSSSHSSNLSRGIIVRPCTIFSLGKFSCRTSSYALARDIPSKFAKSNTVKNIGISSFVL